MVGAPSRVRYVLAHGGQREDPPPGGDEAAVARPGRRAVKHRYPGRRRGQLPIRGESINAVTEPGVRGDTASGGVTNVATLETGLEIRVPLFIKEGEKVKVHTETREFAGRA